MTTLRLLALCTGILCVAAPWQEVTARTASQTGVQITADRIQDLRAWDRVIAAERAAGGLRLRSTRQDPDLPGRQIERLDQMHAGVPVWGGQIVRQSDRGVPLWIFGTMANDADISVDPGLSAAAARAALLTAAGQELITPPQLVILPLPGGGAALAYHAVAGSADLPRIFIDASTGIELWRYSELRSQSFVGTGQGVLGDTKKLSVQRQAGTYVASDSHRPPVINTYDMNGDLSRTKTVLIGGGALASSDLAADADNVWTDQAVVDAHAHVAWTYDFFFKRFGRHGLDDRDRPIFALVNPVSQQGALALPVSDLVFALNAFWCPVCGPNNAGMMLFGNGIPPNFSFQGRRFNYLSGALDVVAHELTHAVVSSTSDLIGSNESGALNEAFADMMGTSTEFFYRDLNAYQAPADYLIGEDVVRGARPGIPDGVRSMANPGAYGDPDHYRFRYTGPSDSGGLHENASIPNHAFYLAIEGGTNRTSGLTVGGVGAANRDQIEKAFYRAFTLMLPASATFVTARGATTQAARDLYGAGSRAEQMIDLAWSAVGVPDPRSVGTVSGTVGASAQVSFAFPMNATGVFNLNLRGNSRELDLDVYLTSDSSSCSQWPLPPSCVLATSVTPEAVESISYPVRINDAYRVWIDNLGPRSSTFTLEYFITP